MTPEAVEDIVRNLPVGLKSLSLDGFFDIDLDELLALPALHNEIAQVYAPLIDAVDIAVRAGAEVNS
jgi:hypothetical protein